MAVIPWLLLHEHNSRCDHVLGVGDVLCNQTFGITPELCTADELMEVFHLATTGDQYVSNPFADLVGGSAQKRSRSRCTLLRCGWS